MESIYWIAAVPFLALFYWVYHKKVTYDQQFSLLLEQLESKTIELAKTSTELKKARKNYSQANSNLKRAIQTSTAFDKENMVLKEEVAELQLKLRSSDLTKKLASIKDYSEEVKETDLDSNMSVFSILCENFLGPETVNYDNSTLDYPLQKDVCNGHDIYYLHEYYPKNKYPLLPRAFENKCSRIIAFKDQDRIQIDYYAKEIANNFVDAFNRGVFKRESNDLIAIVPSSLGNLMTTIHYYSFCQHIASRTLLVNGLDVIQKGDRLQHPQNHRKRLSKADYLEFNAEKVRGNTVYLIDVNITSGRTFSFCSEKLMELGAKNVIGIFLSKSVDWHGRVRWLEPAWQI